MLSVSGPVARHRGHKSKSNMPLLIPGSQGSHVQMRGKGVQKGPSGISGHSGCQTCCRRLLLHSKCIVFQTLKCIVEIKSGSKQANSSASNEATVSRNCNDRLQRNQSGYVSWAQGFNRSVGRGMGSDLL